MVKFDRFIFVDWSASATPTKGENSIWVGSCQANGDLNSFDAVLTNYERGSKIIDNWNDVLNKVLKDIETFSEYSFVANPPTRRAAFDFLKAILEENHKNNQKTLIGFDFGFGYPYKAYQAHMLGEEWKDLWGKIYAGVFDKEKNIKEVDRFVLANKWNKDHGLCFWGEPNAKKGNDSMGLKKEEVSNIMRDVGEFRITEERVRWSGVKSQWQLYGAGSVGSQTLFGIPYAYELRKYLKENNIETKVWPFETEFGKDLKNFDVLICEIHFGALFRVQERIARKIETLKCQNKSHEFPKEYPKDRIQVEEMCRFFAEEDKDGSMLQKFLEVDCACVSEDDKITAQTKEGWILGVPLCLQPCDRPH